MAYGDLKVRNLIWNTGSGDNTVVLSTLATQSYVTTNFAPKSNPTFAGTINGADLILSGNLTVNGTQTIINTQTLDVEDKQIEIGKVSSPSDTTANEGGWKLKGASDKTFLWYNSTDAWTSSEHIHLIDNKKLLLGTDSDLQFWHDGSHAYLHVDTGDFIIQDANGSNQLKISQDGAVNLRHNGTNKLSTTATGCTVSGNLIASGSGNSTVTTTRTGGAEMNIHSQSIRGIVGTVSNHPLRLMANGSQWIELGTSGYFDLLGDNQRLRIGASQDLQIYHDGTDSHIDSITGGIHIKDTGGYMRLKSDDLKLESATDEDYIACTANGSVDIYHNGVKKLETTSSGINVTGQINVNGSALSAAPEVELTASGSISNNQAVIVNSSGQAVAVTQSTAVASPPTSSFAGIITGNTLSHASFADACYDASTDRYVQINRDGGNGGFFVYVGQMVNGTMSWGSKSGYLGFLGNCREVKIESNGAGKVFALGHEWSNSGQTKAICGTINAAAKTVSFGSAINTGTAGTQGIYLSKPVWTSSTNVLQIRRDGQSSNNFRVYTYTVTGTSVQQHGLTNIAQGDSNAAMAYRNNKVAIGYRNSSNTLSVRFAYMSNSNQTINLGSTTTVSGVFVNIISVAWVNDTTAVFVFRDNTASKGTSIAFTIGSGSTDNTVTSQGSLQYYQPSNEGSTPQIYWDNDISRLVCTYRQTISSKDNAITVLGNYTGSNSVTWDTSNTCQSRNTVNDSGVNEGFTSMNDTTNDRQVIMAPGSGGSNQTHDYSTFIVETQSSTTNMTTGNFLGFSSAAYSNGQTATINVVGNTTTQSSLTAGSKYYVQKNGSLATTATTPSVEAGLALSSTKLLIKG